MDLQCHLSWSSLPAEPCFFLPALATASSWQHQLLQRAQANKHTNVSYQGLQSTPSVLTCSVTEILLTMGNQRHKDNTPQAMLAGANLRRNEIIFNKLEISLPKIHPGNLTGKANFHGQGYSFQDVLLNHHHLSLDGAGRELALTPPLLSSSPGPRSQIAHSLLIIYSDNPGMWGKALFATSSNSPSRDNISSGRNEVGSNL